MKEAQGDIVSHRNEGDPREGEAEAMFVDATGMRQRKATTNE